MLFFRQVATKTQIRAEDYLRMTFEHDAEFVRGELVERSIPDEIHSAIQFLISIGSLIPEFSLYPRPEIRMKLSEGSYRVADIAVFAGSHPRPVPDVPPLVVVEILSKHDRYVDLMEKLGEYRQWGVEHIWVIDPLARKFSVYTDLVLHNVTSLALPGYPFQLTPVELFASL